MLLLLMDVCVCGVCVCVCGVCVPPEAVSLGVCGVVCYVCCVCVCCVLCVCVCMTPPPRRNLCAHVCVCVDLCFVEVQTTHLYSHTRQPNAAKVWAPPRRIPKAVVFDANDAEHLDAIEAYVVV